MVKQALARHYFKNRQVDEAEQTVNEILKAQPNFFPARLLSGEILLVKNESAQAVELFSQLAEEEPDSDRVQFLKAFAHSNNGNIALAKAGAARALEIEPEKRRSPVAAG